MPFAYYDRLSAARQRTYRKSDAIEQVPVPDGGALMPLAAVVADALAAGARAPVERASQALADALNAQLGTPPTTVSVLERRPSDDHGELHGYYEPEDDGKAARITLWMRTAAKAQVVKPRTFVRILLHELCHHFDYEYFKLPETFHTEGFYKRESFLLAALLGPAPAKV